ncbi:hypothetical protein NOM01_15145 [Sporolactobacillus sp. STSJ-5]|uniref:hypothetical protein n=1 Tax=Sporolactobacillus sp. STSJ-5 TaxID=2965076 RepID=UPI002106B8F0|nr:hypothetical protein [Sporolactobacillus sp. STSJ-5]MCQ2011314.1 hypothetical protein [Sporolactobacillus sp. STSJ-5]
MKKYNYAILLLIFILVLTGCSDKYTFKDGRSFPVKRVEGSFIINPDNERALVGYADYVFVGYVNQLLDTDFKNPVETETKDGGTKTVADPFTNYKVTVIQNLKGDLITNQEIPIVKEGGLTQDKKTVQLYENDTLPVEGNYYIFIGYAQPDGSLLISGPNSNKELTKINGLPSVKTSSLINKVKADDQVLKIKKAVDNQITKDRKRFTSKYESNKKK